jgi:DnaJ-class molecular chaperone
MTDNLNTLADRNCDLIEGMDYLETCRMCAGEGAYNQTYTAGCGQGSFTMKGTCDHCGGTGIRTKHGGKVSRSHLNQIDTRRAALRARSDTNG